MVTNDIKPKTYDIPIQSIRFYCKLHNYEFVFAVDSDFDCPHQDKLSRRHCAATKILPFFDAILFLDADIGVVNPNRKNEEFMEEGIDIIIYDREIMAGSYIAKNTQYAVDLLNDSFMEFIEYRFAVRLEGEMIYFL